MLVQMTTAASSSSSSSATGPQRKQTVTFMQPDGSVISEQELAKMMDGVASSLSELRSNIETFDPRVSPGKRRTGREGSPDQGANAGREERQEALERLRERMEAYKMVRHYEHEALPPLRKQAVGPRLPPPQRGITLRNASHEELQRWAPEARRQRLENLKEERDERTHQAARNRQMLLEAEMQTLMQDLARKRRQAEMAQHRPSGAAPTSDPVSQWLTIVAFCHFMDSVKMEMELSRKTQVERIRYVQKMSLTASATKLRRSSMGDMLDQAHANSMLEKLRIATEKIRVMVCTWKYGKKKKLALQNAKMIVDALKSWKVAGKLLTSLKSMMIRIHHIQLWWRAVSKRLKEHRDHVSKRWEALERAEIERELHKIIANEKKSKNQQLRVLSFEDRIELEKLPEATRLRFIENQLRAKRYFMLPDIIAWEADAREWKVEYSRYQDNKAAMALMGVTESDHNLRWPPSRPSALPPNHPRSEGKHYCHPDCLGRRGDQEILRWYHTARGNPQGWLQIPQSKRAFRSRSNPKDGAAEQAPDKPPVPAGPYGDVVPAAEELKMYGVDSDQLPGQSALDPLDKSRIPPLI